MTNENERHFIDIHLNIAWSHHHCNYDKKTLIFFIILTISNVLECPSVKSQYSIFIGWNYLRNVMSGICVRRCDSCNEYSISCSNINVLAHGWVCTCGEGNCSYFSPGNRPMTVFDRMIICFIVCLKEF